MDPQVGAKLEFCNKTRAQHGALPRSDFGGEIRDLTSHNKVIIRLPGNNTVFNRDGAWLRGGGLTTGTGQAEK